MNYAHWHLILNHVPVVGSAFVLALLAWALLRRSEELKSASLGAAVLVALLTIPTYMTGDPAFEAAMEVLEATPEEEDPLVEMHKSAAAWAFGAAELTGVIALAALVHSRIKKTPLSPALTLTALLLLVATAILLGRTANLGGAIRHSEIRPGPAPAAP
jgi:hypothetical protein